MKKKNYKFLCKCFTVIELLACIVIWGGWLRYTLYHPIVRLSEMDFSSELAYGYDEEEKMLYPKPYCIIDRDGNYAMYVQGFMANEISQSIFVSDIKVNILDVYSNYLYDHKGIFPLPYKFHQACQTLPDHSLLILVVNILHTS